MYRKVLIPTDGSTLARAVATAGINFARGANASVVGFAVAPTFRRPLMAAALDDDHLAERDYRERTDRLLEKLLAAIRTKAKAAGVSFEGQAVFSDDTAREIVDAAQRNQCDLIFMGSHRRLGLARLIRRSVTAKVIALSEVPVTVYRVTPEELARYANYMDGFGIDAPMPFSRPIYERVSRTTHSVVDSVGTSCTTKTRCLASSEITDFEGRMKPKIFR